MKKVKAKVSSCFMPEIDAMIDVNAESLKKEKVLHEKICNGGKYDSSELLYLNAIRMINASHNVFMMITRNGHGMIDFTNRDEDPYIDLLYRCFQAVYSIFDMFSSYAAENEDEDRALCDKIHGCIDMMIRYNLIPSFHQFSNDYDGDADLLNWLYMCALKYSPYIDFIRGMKDDD